MWDAIHCLFYTKLHSSCEFLKCWPYYRKWDLVISLLGLDSAETSRGNSHVRISSRKSDDTDYKFKFLPRTCSDFSVGGNWYHLTTVFPINLRLRTDTYLTHKYSNNYSSLYKYLKVSQLHQNQHENTPQVLWCKQQYAFQLTFTILQIRTS